MAGTALEPWSRRPPLPEEELVVLAEELLPEPLPEPRDEEHPLPEPLPEPVFDPAALDFVLIPLSNSELDSKDEDKMRYLFK